MARSGTCSKCNYVVARIDRDNSGVSPAISAVILVAIAVIIASSLAAYASGFFNNFSQSANIKILSLEVNDDGTGMMQLANSGAQSDVLQSIQVHPNDPVILNHNGEYPHSKSKADHDNNGKDNGNNGVGTQNDPVPQCSEHSDTGNCLHDKGKGKSGDSHGQEHDNNNNDNSGGGDNDGSNGDALDNWDPSSEDANTDQTYLVDTVIPANGSRELFWDESLGHFNQGQQITVSITFASGNELTYYAIIS